MSSDVTNFTATLDRIRAWAKVNNWTPARLAGEAGLTDKATRGMDDADWTPSGSSIRAFEKIIPDHWMPGDPLPREKRVASRSARRRAA